jgi:hypothetical protein
MQRLRFAFLETGLRMDIWAAGAKPGGHTLGKKEDPQDAIHLA